MSSTAYLSTIQQYLTRYGMSTYVAFGNLGNFLIIAVFSQVEQRRNSCSFYLLWMTICNLVCLDVGIIPVIFALDHTDISNQYDVACKIQFYIRHASFQMMRQYKVLACIDRFALTSSSLMIRNFSHYKIAKYLVMISGIFWALVAIFFVVVRTVANGSCGIQDNLYSTIYTIYYMIFAGLLPPCLILLFSFLVMRNLKLIRTRIKPVVQTASKGNVLRKRDRDLMKMVLVEVLFYVISTLPFSIYLVYKMITDGWSKSNERKQIESFINYLTQTFLMYFNTALPFYIYITASSSFRQQTKHVLLRFYAFMIGKQLRIDQNEQTMTKIK